MKRRILSIIMVLVMLMSMVCINTTIVYAGEQAEVNGTVYWSHRDAWKAAVDRGGTFKLLEDWRPSSKDFGSDAVGDAENYFVDGAIRVPEGKSVTIDLNGHSISRNLYYGSNDPVSDGEVIYLERDAQLTIKDTSASGNGRIEDGNSSNGAGGIHAKPGSRIYMYSGAIAYCQSDKRNRGAAVYLDSGAMMYMYGGRIYSNKYTGSNGSSGIFVDKDARFYMYGGSIDNNKSEEEGAVYVNNTYTLFQGGTIRDNYSKNNGSAVYCEGFSSDVHFNGTEITGNTGGFAVSTRGSKYTFSSGKIHNNSGGGVMVLTAMVVTGDVQIFGNKDTDGTFCDLYLGYRTTTGYTAQIYFTDDIKETAKIGYLGSHSLISSNYSLDGDKYAGDKYCKYLYTNSSDYRIINDDEFKKFESEPYRVSCVKVSEVGEDSFITGVSSVKDKNGSVSYTCDVDKDTRSVTIHVPQDIDTSALAIGLNTTGVATEAVTRRDVLIQPITPSADTYTDFKTTEYGNTRAYTLLNVDKKTQQNWTITVENDMAIPSYSVTVNSGTGGGTYKRNTEVTVTANEVENKRFVKWSATGVTLSDTQLSSSSMTFTMPDNAVTLTAEYEDLTNSVALTIDEPYGGKSFDSYATLTYEGGKTAELPVSWSPSAAKAEFEGTYTAVITVTNEYGFSNNLTATVNGNTAEVRRPDSKTAVITYSFTTAKAKLISIPKARYEVANGIAAGDIVLPDEIGIVTENDGVSKANVTWNSIPSSAYDQAGIDEQSFTVDGTITLPEVIDQNEVSLDAQIEVVVAEANRASAPTANLISGSTYTENQSLVLSTDTEGAAIYYTTDGTKLSKDNGTLYTSPVELTGEVDKTIIHRIRAVAVLDGTNDSRVSDFVINIAIPLPTYTVSIVDKDDNTAGLGGGTYHAGDTVTVKTINMADRYVFKSWTVKSGSLELTEEQKGTSTFSFTMPAEDVTLTPEFLDAVTRIELDIDAPVLGEALDTSAGYALYNSVSEAAVAEGTDILSVAWLPNNAVAKSGTEYSSAVTLKPSGDIVFANSVKANVSGAASTKLIKNDDGSVDVYYTFPKTANAKLISIENPADLYIPNDADVDPLTLLPTTVRIVTTDSDYYSADVEWADNEEFASYYDWQDSYNDYIDAMYYDFTGEVILPEGVDANGVDCTVTISVGVQNDIAYVEAPYADVLPGVYTDNQTITLSVDNTYNFSKIMYSLDGSNPLDGSEYTEPIVLTGTAGEAKTILLRAVSVSSSGSIYDSPVQEYKYTIVLPEKTQAVEVINGVGSGEYNLDESINIVAQPASGTVFKNWKAERVKYTTEPYERTETIFDENGNPKQVTITGTMTTRNATEIEDVLADASRPVTTLTVPALNDGEILEVTAECAEAITAVSFRVAIPAAGEALPTAITSGTSGISIITDSFTITPADGKAKFNTRYTVSTGFTVADGYTLGETPSFSINGVSVQPTANDDGSYTVSYAFTTEDSITVGGVSAKATDGITVESYDGSVFAVVIDTEMFGGASDNSLYIQDIKVAFKKSGETTYSASSESLSEYTYLDEDERYAVFPVAIDGEISADLAVRGMLETKPSHNSEGTSVYYISEDVFDVKSTATAE